MANSASSPSPPDRDPARDPLRGLSPAALLAAGLATEPPASDASARESGPPPPSPAELAPEFSALDILELLGRGGMGAVYRARQRDLDRLVALKILRPGLDSDPGFAERFAREARALAQLNHPGIVTLYEFGRTQAGRYFILMEFVDGVNLRQLLAAGRLAPREALAIVPPLCDALQYAHDRGLVHRDIKPENILADRLGRVKIADFGLARLAAAAPAPPAADASRRTADAPPADTGPARRDALTFAGEIMGTPAYMAPEQRSRPGEVDHRADLYALGVVLYQMLTGELPPPGQLQPPSRRVSLDVRLDAIVLRALEADPALRYAAASEFKTHLETLAATPPSPASASPEPGPPAPAHAPAATAPPRAADPPPPARAEPQAHGRLALGLFLAGALGSPLLAAFTRDETPPLLFGGLALLLALVFGVIGRRQRFAKIAATLSAIILVGVLALFGWSRHQRSERLDEATARKLHAYLEAKLATTRPPSGPAAPATITVTLRGAVARPGAHTLPAPASLLDALAAAGGWTRSADWSAITIQPPGSAPAEIHNLGAILQGEAVNPRLPADAVVTVPSL